MTLLSTTVTVAGNGGDGLGSAESSTGGARSADPIIVGVMSADESAGAAMPAWSVAAGTVAGVGVVIPRRSAPSPTCSRGSGWAEALAVVQPREKPCRKTAGPSHRRRGRASGSCTTLFRHTFREQYRCSATSRCRASCRGESRPPRPPRDTYMPRRWRCPRQPPFRSGKLLCTPGQVCGVIKASR